MSATWSLPPSSPAELNLKFTELVVPERTTGYIVKVTGTPSLLELRVATGCPKSVFIDWLGSAGVGFPV